jgi:hypothetical protein
MSYFRKEKDCPSSYELADSVVGQLGGDQALRIAGHLASCDFCAAEIEFYKHYPPVMFSAEPAPGPIPDPLFELAQSTLTKESVSRSRLEFLLDEAA